MFAKRLYCLNFVTFVSSFICLVKSDIFFDLHYLFYSINSYSINSDLLLSLRKKCPYLELFWSVFSRIRTKYGDILRISPYSIQMRENRTRITPNMDTFHAVCKAYIVIPAIHTFVLQVIYKSKLTW